MFRQEWYVFESTIPNPKTDIFSDLLTLLYYRTRLTASLLNNGSIVGRLCEAQYNNCIMRETMFYQDLV